MRIHSVLLCLFLAWLICFTGCNRKAKISAELLDSLKTEYKILTAAVDTSWKIMIDEDDRKLINLKRLLQEVSRTNHYDTIKCELLMKRLEALKNFRYDRRSMSNSSLIDQYDSITIKLVPEIREFTQSDPQFANYRLMGELIIGINEMDNNVLFKRVDYDKTAKKFNEFVMKNEEVLKENLPDADINKKPLFEIPTN